MAWPGHDEEPVSSPISSSTSSPTTPPTQKSTAMMLKSRTKILVSLLLIGIAVTVYYILSYCRRCQHRAVVTYVSEINTCVSEM